MIIGSGMVAGALKDLTGWNNDILFTSGVSNSGENDLKSFRRETDLVDFYLRKLEPSASFVYFSTTSIFDPSKQDNEYIKHKLFIENFIRRNDVNYLILRLPNLVGFSKNPHTLTNYFADSIRLKRTIQLNHSAVRHLIDVDDLSSILNDINSKFGKNRVTVNVETDRPLSAVDILSMLEKVMMNKATVQLVKGVNDKNNIAASQEYQTMNYLWKTGNDYHLNLLAKYYSI